MSTVSIRQIPAHEVSEGAGVTVHRTIGTPALKNFDPFLMLDHFGSDDPDEYIAGFPPHPHRGFITFTYMIDGHMQHKDSMGNTGDLSPGAAQWMRAASGVIHSEMPKQEQGLMRGFQLWINLPASEKMSDPEYQEFAPDAFPSVKSNQAEVKVLIGNYQHASGPIIDTDTNIQYLDVQLAENGQFDFTLNPEHNTFLYIFEGVALLNGQAVKRHHLLAIDKGATDISVSTADSDARFILVSGRPIGESIVQYGPFVMNSNEEIHQAMADYQNGTLVRKKANMVTA
ncbi:MAG: pirin family protein [Gammaproteobacteria bacterium]|nr:pirin family protein [Gammaproteobacteria bacterium]